ncbi:MAG: hypothetical protein SX243_21260 [Acidobacteriota bacterium]|nr:hypothetical protein [Acidobacteriota bacterium]
MSDHFRSFAFLFLALALLLTPLGVSAQETAREAAPATDAAYYLFQAEQLGDPGGSVSVRFEYRQGYHVVGTTHAQVNFDGAQSRLVQIPSSLWNRALLDGEPEDLRVRVYAAGLLVADLDRQELLDYNRNLAYTQGLEQDLRSFGTKIQCDSPCSGGCGPYDDYDCDGVANYTDNCIDDANSNQADCDNDGAGDVCDYLDATYQGSGSIDTCMTDKDDHGAYITFEHHVEQWMVDVSSCGAPSMWSRWVRMDNDCFSYTDKDCCNGLRNSIAAVGDDFMYWCANGIRNYDFCH